MEGRIEGLCLRLRGDLAAQCQLLSPSFRFQTLSRWMAYNWAGCRPFASATRSLS
jgi:hypothetical protein